MAFLIIILGTLISAPDVYPERRLFLVTDESGPQCAAVMTPPYNLITSQGPGTALEFAMEVIIQLSGKKHAWSVAEPMIPLPTLHYHKLGEE